METDGNSTTSQVENMETLKLIRQLKIEKSKVKSSFTRARRQLINLLESQDVSIEVQDILEATKKLDVAQELAIEAMASLSKALMDIEDFEAVDKLSDEMERLEIDFSDSQRDAVSFIKCHKRQASSRRSSISLSQNSEPLEKEDQLENSDEACQNPKELEEPATHKGEKKLGQDMWKQLKRVTIPVFSGNVQRYESWKAAFLSCVDQAPATDEYKLLQLRQSLSGEALKVVESLGHSAAAYQAAKERLDRKYGGHRRKVALQLEEIHSFKPLRPGNSKDIERFADLLDVAIVNMKDSGVSSELESRVLYSILLRKITEDMVTSYKRWVAENHKEESVSVLRDYIIKEAEYRTVAHETVKGVMEASDISHAVHSTKKERTHFTRSGGGRRKCVYCHGDHPIWSCSDFKQSSPEQRWMVAKKQSLCFRCLSEGHRGSRCKFAKVCGIEGCDKTHNRLLHTKKQKDSSTESESSDQARLDRLLDVSTDRTHTTQDSRSDRKTGSQVVLRMVPVIVKSGNRQMKINALLDDASTSTYLNSSVASELGLQGKLEKARVNVLNGQVETFQTMPVKVSLESLDGRVSIAVNAKTADRVTGGLSAIDWNRFAGRWKHLRGIKFPIVGKKPTIDMLIGLDYSDLHVSLKEVVGKPGEPVARLTRLGWTCVGSIPGRKQSDNSHFAHTYLSADRSVMSELNSKLRQFWEVEKCGARSVKYRHIKPEEKAAIATVEKTITDVGGRYQVGIPWKDDRPNLPNNHEMAVERLKRTESRLRKNTVAAESYSDTIKQYISKGYVRKVNPDEPEVDNVWYLPHFAVIRPDKATTKTRIVFDASARFKGTSLNDNIHQGPKLHRELFDVLTRFRKHSVALICDIAEMYLQIEIAPEDRSYHRFLWRDLDESKHPEVHEFSRLVFGVNASPFLAQYVAQEHARRYVDVYSKAATTVLKSTYMDDSMDSVATIEEGCNLYRELSELWGKAGMYARKWLSNSEEVLRCIPPEERASEIDLEQGQLPSTKTLGVLWVANEDCFAFKPVPLQENAVLTKRTFLSKIATIFDPLGFLAPYIIRGKILMQQIWAAGFDWDDRIVGELEQRVRRWFKQLSELEDIKIARCLSKGENGSIQTSNIHVFVDASQEAYAAVAYLRTTYSDRETVVRFIASKTRVTPLKSYSIPRLELMAAVLGLNLGISITETLEMPLDCCTFWSDSMNVLWWVRGASRNFRTFVANRVGDIQEHSNPEQWCYVPTDVNPADMSSRGLDVSQLIKSELWWSGPKFLRGEKAEWPQTKIPSTISQTEELKKAKIPQVTLAVCCEHKEEQKPEWRLQPMCFSSWLRLVRVTAWVRRFIWSLQHDLHNRYTGALKSSEIELAKQYHIVSAQKEAFQDEYQALLQQKELPVSSKLLSLNPKLDSEGLIRSDGRLTYSEVMSYDARHPIILPRGHWVTRLIVRHAHELGQHIAGVSHTLATLRAKYWILRGREEVRDCERTCMLCRRNRSKVAQQIMAPLPEIRIKEPFRAFHRVAVDFAGPFMTKQGRGKPQHKRYLCLFTCLASRAVHLEIAYGLDTDSFLHALFRMINRRGVPSEIISDNGGNFVRANKELNQLVSQLNQDKISQSLANRSIQWHFNPPLAPHFGGVHETMVKSAKRAISAILSKADITDEELVTAFTGAEALLNSRPLTYQTCDPKDDVPLTPNHFLFGQAGGQFAPEALDSTKFQLQKRWRYVQELVKHFWRRWLKEWVPMLNARKKWQQLKRDIKINDVVLVVEPESTRGHWPLGRVIEVFPGKDGHVRVVKVQVGTSTFIRPISKICPLNLDEV